MRTRVCQIHCSLSYLHSTSNPVGTSLTEMALKTCIETSREAGRQRGRKTERYKGRGRDDRERQRDGNRDRCKGGHSNPRACGYILVKRQIQRML